MQYRNVVRFKLVSIDAVQVVFCERPDVIVGPILNCGELVEKLPLQLLSVVDGVADEEGCRVSFDNGG